MSDQEKLSNAVRNKLNHITFTSIVSFSSSRTYAYSSCRMIKHCENIPHTLKKFSVCVQPTNQPDTHPKSPNLNGCNLKSVTRYSLESNRLQHKYFSFRIQLSSLVKHNSNNQRRFYIYNTCMYSIHPLSLSHTNTCMPILCTKKNNMLWRTIHFFKHSAIKREQLGTTLGDA